MILPAASLTVNVRIDERELSALRQRAPGTLETDTLAESLHRATGSHVAVPAKVDFSPIGRIVCPGKQTRHRLAKARKHVVAIPEVGVIALLKVGAIVIRCGEINLKLALNDNRHLNVIALTSLAKGNGQERKTTLAVIPIGAWAKRHILLAVVHHTKPGIVRCLFILNEHTVLELEHLRLGRYVRIGAVLVIQSAGVGEATVRDDI